MTISVITPTANRPIGFALAEGWMARQTRKPEEWIVADGGTTPVVCTMGQRHLHAPDEPGTKNFLANLRRGVQAATGDLLVWWEDDDWYAPHHLETLEGQCSAATLAAGDDLQQYYNLRHRVWRTFNNRGASLCQTAMTRAAVPLFLTILDRCQTAGLTYGVDGAFWAAVPARAKSLKRTQTVVGIKGLPGQVGLGIGHRPRLSEWHADRHFSTLTRWIGAADVERYKTVITES